MKKFNDILNQLQESPVGKVGRTSGPEAEEYVNNSQDLEKRFKKIVKSMGGKEVAKKALEKMKIK